MDINDFRALATVLTLLAFIGVCLWAYSCKRKSSFEDAAQLPFADDDIADEAHKPGQNRGGSV